MDPKEQVNQLIELTKNVASHGNEYIDRIIEQLAPIQEIGGVAAGVYNLWNFAKLQKFKRFLKRYAKSFQEESVTEEKIQKLKDYLKNERNLVFVSETIDNAIHAQSAVCSAILGGYAGQILAKTKEITYKDLIVINALRMLNDFDLEQFLFLYRFITNRGDGKDLSYRIYDLQTEVEELGQSPFSLEVTIEKLKNWQLLGYDVGGLSNVGNAWGAFKFNEYTHYFYEIVQQYME